MPLPGRRDPREWGRPDFILQGARRYPGMAPGPWMPQQDDIAGLIQSVGGWLTQNGSDSVASMAGQLTGTQQGMTVARMKGQEIALKFMQERQKYAQEALLQRQTDELMAYADIYQTFSDDPEKQREEIDALERKYGDRHVRYLLDNDPDALRKIHELMSRRDMYNDTMAKVAAQDQKRYDEELKRKKDEAEIKKYEAETKKAEAEAEKARAQAGAERWKPEWNAPLTPVPPRAGEAPTPPPLPGQPPEGAQPPAKPDIYGGGPVDAPDPEAGQPGHTEQDYKPGDQTQPQTPPAAPEPAPQPPSEDQSDQESHADLPAPGARPVALKVPVPGPDAGLPTEPGFDDSGVIKTPGGDFIRTDPQRPPAPPPPKQTDRLPSAPAPAPAPAPGGPPPVQGPGDVLQPTRPPGPDAPLDVPDERVPPPPAPAVPPIPQVAPVQKMPEIQVKFPDLQMAPGSNIERTREEALQYYENMKLPYSTFSRNAAQAGNERERNDYAMFNSDRIRQVMDAILAQVPQGTGKESWQEQATRAARILRAVEKIDPALASVLGQVLRGDTQLPMTGFAANTPVYKLMDTLAHRIDPTFGAGRWQVNNRTRVAYHVGTQAQQRISTNRSIGHLADLWFAVQVMDNSRFQDFNAFVNSVRTRLAGDARGPNFDVALNAVANEMERAFRGSGGSQKGIDEIKASMSRIHSKAQMLGWIATSAQLLKEQMDSAASIYSEATFAPKTGEDMLDDRARDFYRQLSRIPTSGQWIWTDGKWRTDPPPKRPPDATEQKYIQFIVSHPHELRSKFFRQTILERGLGDYIPDGAD